MTGEQERLGWYVVEAEVGKTTCGRLVRARDTDLGVESLVEILDPVVAKDTALLKRFKDEIRRSRAISNPGLSRPLDVVSQGGVAFTVFELVPGEPISTRMGTKGLSVLDALRVIRKAADAVAELHAHDLVHRALSVDALIERPDGLISVTRFGIATAGELTTRGGTPTPSPYAAPESLRDGEATKVADVYGLGAVLFALATGAPPGPTAKSLSSLVADAPAALDEIIERAMLVDPTQRFESAQAFVNALATVEALLGISDPHAGRVGVVPDRPPLRPKTEDGLPDRSTTRVTEPTHVMALPPHSSLSMEAPGARGAMLPEFIADQLQIPALDDDGAASSSTSSSSTSSSSTSSAASLGERKLSPSLLKSNGPGPHTDLPAVDDDTNAASETREPDATVGALIVDDVVEETTEGIDDDAPERVVEGVAADDAEVSTAPPPGFRPAMSGRPVSAVVKSAPTKSGGGQREPAPPFGDDHDPDVTIPAMSSPAVLDVDAPSTHTGAPVTSLPDGQVSPPTGESAHVDAASPPMSSDAGGDGESDDDDDDGDATEIDLPERAVRPSLEGTVPALRNPHPRSLIPRDVSIEGAPVAASAERRADDGEDLSIAGDDPLDPLEHTANVASPSTEEAPAPDDGGAARAHKPARAQRGDVVGDDAAEDHAHAASSSDPPSEFFRDEHATTTDPGVRSFERTSTEVLERQRKQIPIALKVAAGVVLVVGVGALISFALADEDVGTDTLVTTDDGDGKPVGENPDDKPKDVVDGVSDDDGGEADAGPDVPDSGVVDDDPVPDDPTDPGVDVRDPDDPRSPDQALKGRIASEKKSVTKAMAKRGLRPGDDDTLDQHLQAVMAAEERERFSDALSELVRARRRAADITIDREFIARKMERTEVAMKDLSKRDRRKAAKLIDKANAQVKRGKFSSAHIYLNRVWKLVRTR